MLNMIKRKTWIIACVLFLYSCHIDDRKEAVVAIPETEPALAINDPSNLRLDGRRIEAPVFGDIYEKIDLNELKVPFVSSQTMAVLSNQLKLLDNPKIKRNHRIGDLRIHVSDLRETIEILKSRQQTLPLDLGEYLDAYQIWGKDRKGHVKFTGYFTPLIQVSKTQTSQFKYPIYSRPKNWEGQLPTRREIEQDGVLKGLGLELAFAADKVDIYYMQVQGSGYVEYPDGSKELFSFNGSNRHPYRSIEKFIKNSSEIQLTNLSIDGIKRYLQNHPEFVDTVLFHNPSYTFFHTKKSSEPVGAGTVPLMGHYSVAVDKRYIPLGSCLLGAFPIYDKFQKRVTHFEYKLLFAQDVGGAIKGPGHIDYYFGIGDKAKREAGYLNHYGQLWLLLPKRQIGPVFTSY